MLPFQFTSPTSGMAVDGMELWHGVPFGFFADIVKTTVAIESFRGAVLNTLSACLGGPHIQFL